VENKGYPRDDIEPRRQIPVPTKNLIPNRTYSFQALVNGGEDRTEQRARVQRRLKEPM